MALNNAIDAIYSRVASMWPTIEPTVPYGRESADFERPYDVNGRPLPFIVIDPEWTGADFASIGAPGNNRVRRHGLIGIHAFIPLGGESLRAHELVAKAGAMFEGYDFGGIVCWELAPGGPADSEDGAYFGQSAFVEFYYDETV